MAEFRAWMRRGAMGLLVLLVAASVVEARNMSACKTDGPLLDLGITLDATHKAATERKQVRIVAIGSSSTQGYGAAPGNSYPAQVMKRLGETLKGVEIVVFNRGVGGQDTDAMADRIERDVIAEKPDLVIFQAGTNAALRRIPVERFARRLDVAVERSRAGGADVVLMDLQYAPAVISLPDEDIYVGAMREAASRHGVGLFQRFNITRSWYDRDNMSWSDFMTSDGLHLNDFGQKCIGKLLAKAIERIVIARATGAMQPKR
ncbi:MAG: SGNH/GDSL hydrolase family protein [Alphaproteobacteria bacterium]|nr:SGNH/GDSL hydrolase family protein [Alphaproteobacteria bacterium]MCW5744487.1 SGNH/GDSL hydrolase family protein [Alphaproteobacteria bacterium]